MTPGQLYASEFIGTFMLIFIGCGAVLTDANGYAALSPVGISLCFGFVVMGMIYAVGHISAAHFNPAVTLGFAVARRFPARHILPYWAAQFAGAILASLSHLLLYGSEAAAKGNFGATSPRSGSGQAFGFEAILTFCLMWVIIAVATDRRAAPGFAGLAIGLTVATCALMGGGVCGASMNPARSLGPALFSGGTALESLWLYIAAPMAGAALAALSYERVRGSEEFASSAPQILAEMENPKAVRAGSPSARPKTLIP
ncbi:MAG: MIP family channel protein [Armatimonadetes bacterium]|nr:MIP family channel protein [Armatimonadota bacterium]